MKKLTLLISAVIALVVTSCAGNIDIASQDNRMPDIYPDYKDVTVPSNIAPLNFNYMGNEPAVMMVSSKGGDFVIKGRDGLFDFGEKRWAKLLADNRGAAFSCTIAVRRDNAWVAYEPFFINVMDDEIDPFISYRLIPPGYQGWKRMGLYQRDLRTYSQTAILENVQTGENCLNCHTPCKGDPKRTVFHARADFGGTMIQTDGIFEKLNTKTDSTISALVYPYWHPSGEYIAFSVNATKQSFFNHGPDRIEVFDSASDIVLYDVRDHSITWSPLTKDPARFETFPTFSPDGEWLYFCSSAAVEHMPDDYDQARYGLYRIAFNAADKSFGDSLECIYDAPAEGKSVSFPRISPDGRWLAFTRHKFGNFSIWHKDADIWMLDLQTGECRPMELNSDEVDSYHCWSTDGRWMVFSSRRDDGLYTRPYISYIDGEGHAHKPFMLPQKNPREFYMDLMFSYNIPEFMTGEVEISEHDLAQIVRADASGDVKVSDLQK